jgi:hypothetical protein
MTDDTAAADESDVTISGILRDNTAAEFAELAAQRIIRAGGAMTTDGDGRNIYPRRVDVRIPITMFDPARQCNIVGVVRLRVTVEFDATFDVREP